MKTKLESILLLFFIILTSCIHFENKKDLFVKYEYDYRISLSDSTFKSFNSLDSIIKYNKKFNSSEKKLNKLYLTICGNFNKNTIRLFNENDFLYKRKITTDWSNDVADFVEIEKNRYKDYTFTIDNINVSKIKFDFRFDYGYLFYEKDTVTIVFTNYKRIMD
jgi:hypothetical protein